VGFGKTLWSRQRGETEYGIKAIPAGGFVKIVGMTQLEEVDPADEPRAFWRQPAGQRAVVLAAGSTVHFIIAIVLVLLSSLAIGKSVELAPAVGAVSPCVTAAATGRCGDGGSLPSPAQAAGLRVGDIVESVNGTRINGYLQLIRELRSFPAETVPVQVLRGDQRLTLNVTPAAVARPPLPGKDGASSGPIERVGAIGVQPQFRSGTERLGPIAAVTNSVETGKLMVTGIISTFSEKIGTITKVYGPDRDPAGFIGVVGAGRISGEVIASPETISTKILSFILLIAGLNLFVGVFNLLPLLPLDGGHLAVLGFEQARDKIKRTFGYAGPLRRVDLTKLLPVTYAVVVFFAGFTVWLLGADIVNPIRLTQ
ncbi:MAG: RIP metalloprotease, partial [Frankiales bacterium]|nr:RIP metalloprotease [Frankiales bacterium]